MAKVFMDIPDNLVEYGTEKGVFSDKWVETMVRDALIDLARKEPCPPGFPPELLGAIDPKTYGKGKINGDIIGPFHEEWGAGL